MPNKQINELFWAFIIALLLASALAAVAYLFPGSDPSREHVFEIANSMVTGALGFFAGRAYRSGDSSQPGAPK